MKNQIDVSAQIAQEIEQNAPNQQSNRKLGNSLYFRILILVAVGVISSLLTRGSLNNRHQSELNKNKNQINQLKEQIFKLESLQSSVGKNQLPSDVTEKNKANPFSYWQNDWLIKDSTVSINPNAGYMVVNSILSNKKDRIIYSEISDCIGLENDPNYKTNGQCDWKYRIYVKSLPSGEPSRLYGYPEDKLSWIDLLVPKVYAGGCPLVYLPIGWSKNDKKIILQSVNPTSCGAGGGTTKYFFASVNSNGGSIEGISIGPVKFYDSFGKAVVVSESDKSPRVCAPINQRNSGKIIFLNTETRENIKTIEESNSDYSLGEISTDKTQIEYYRRPAPENNECAEIDWSSQGEKSMIVLP